MKKINIDFENISNQRSKEVAEFKLDLEANAYNGCRYKILEFKFIQRSSKLTPKKIGQFVTLWKRDKNNMTTPIESKDGIDYVIITCAKGDLVGKFLFPVQVLLEKGIIRKKGSKESGKRGFRVYPDWDRPVSKQAIKTQLWQKEFFSLSLELEIKKL